MAWEVDEAINFVFVLLIEQASDLYDKSLRDHAKRNNMDLAWEWILHEIE